MPIFILLTVSALFGLNPAQAERDPSPHSAAYLVSQTPAAGGFWMALVIDAEKDWHTYWRNPGDSGLPTKLTWELPPGFRAGELQWPFPERMESPPLVTYGYHGRVLLPVHVQTPAGWTPAQPFTVHGKATWLICQDVCLPAKEEVEWKWPNAINQTQDEQAAQIAEALAKLPQNPAIDTTLAFQSRVGGQRFEVSAALESAHAGAARALEFFPYENGSIDHSVALEQGSAQGRLRWVRTLRSDGPTPTQAFGVAVLLGPGDRATAWELKVPALKGDIPRIEVAEKSESPSRWLWMFVSAFLGGLLLNLMPCVFPVLSIKVMSLLEKSKGDAASARRQSLAYLSGVLATFWALSLGLLVLRSTGEQLGWGFQLQSPVFLALLSGLFFLMAFNLLGTFEVGTSWIGAGEGKRRELENRSPIWGSFFTGALAVVVATPCTAPFMGTAVGFAFSQGPISVWLIFTGLGIGLAVPFLLFAAQPRWLAILPRPGMWMETLKQALAFPLFATLIWLLWTLVQQAGAGGLAVTLLGFWCLGLGIWLQRKLSPARGQLALALSAAAAGLVFTFGMMSFEQTYSPGTSTETSGIRWETFSEARLAEYQKAGRPVFVDFTAAWCLTCQVNERVVLTRPEIVQAFQARNIAPLKADWTNRDAVIASHLEKLGRSGVPVYALYSAGGKTPTLLPEILTVTTVLSELEKLSTSSKGDSR